MNNTAERILDIAERLIRSRGYQGFAFREIAEIIGIKSASIHYHFPAKKDLVEAVMKRYLARFELALNNLDSQPGTPLQRAERYMNMYREEITSHRTMTLCMMLGADIEILPDSVVSSLKNFYRLNLDWIGKIILNMASSLSRDEQGKIAAQILASLNGAMIGARALDDMAYFDHVAEGVSVRLRALVH
ncbi:MULTISPECIES: TetR/AcrR family transcriptional regulator [Pseudomonas]|uniref:TetR/AcrR family transcriptional repressor of nem operon n=1 Tax=Phytopseudomonas flavescens TaxID=29435 RepID=A0A7Y9XJ68_9GAMM|nr:MULTISPECIES: TetR/AcrR family transcriptional regulator [Pseudomonas]MCW2293040.1 TetR/AcrR family transcriptional repressor of nem operon [Pseudomonas sp. BIGb0408]NYH72390.1 TetR/AcrR family transcriptional repressor of nem operon [Pseudomonas flavescens]